MIDYFVIMYLIKRFGYNDKFSPQKWLYFKTALIVGLFVVAAIRIIFFRSDAMFLYWGPFYFAGYFGILGYFLLILFFYGGILLLPFLMIVLSLLGFLGLTFFPTVNSDSDLEESRVWCRETGDRYNPNCGRYYIDLVQRHQYEEFVKLSTKDLDMMWKLVRQGKTFPCDPKVDRGIFTEVGGDCSSYQDIHLHLMSDTASFLNYLATVSVEFLYSGLQARTLLYEDEYKKKPISFPFDYRSFHEDTAKWSKQQCLDYCHALPSVVKEVGADKSDYRLTMMGKPFYPEKCEYRCNAAQLRFDMAQKYGVPACYYDLKKIYKGKLIAYPRTYKGYFTALMRQATACDKTADALRFYYKGKTNAQERAIQKRADILTEELRSYPKGKERGETILK